MVLDSVQNDIGGSRVGIRVEILEFNAWSFKITVVEKGVISGFTVA